MTSNSMRFRINVMHAMVNVITNNRNVIAIKFILVFRVMN